MKNSRLNRSEISQRSEVSLHSGTECRRSMYKNKTTWSL